MNKKQIGGSFYEYTKYAYATLYNDIIYTFSAMNLILNNQKHFAVCLCL